MPLIFFYTILIYAYSIHVYICTYVHKGAFTCMDSLALEGTGASVYKTVLICINVFWRTSFSMHALTLRGLHSPEERVFRLSVLSGVREEMLN